MPILLVPVRSRTFRLTALVATCLLSAAAQSKPDWAAPVIPDLTRKPFDVKKLTKIPTINTANLGMPANARKINGRWWTPDNREIVRVNGFWRAQPQIPGLSFYHHRPFRIALADSLRLSITLPQAYQVVGDPNEKWVFVPGRNEAWGYFSADGTETSLWFINGLLADVRLDGGPGQKGVSPLKPRRPAAIQTALGDRDPLMEARKKRTFSRPGASGTDIGYLAALNDSIPTPSPEERRTISPESLAGVTMGMSREEVVAHLGEPAAVFAISGVEGGTRETLTYWLSATQKVLIETTGGKVSKLPAP